MAVDAEPLHDVGTGEGFLHILHAVGQTAAFVGGEGDDGLILQVGLVLLDWEKRIIRKIGRYFPKICRKDYKRYL